MARLVDEHGVPAQSAWEAFSGLFASDRRRERKRTPPREDDADDHEMGRNGIPQRQKGKLNG